MLWLALTVSLSGAGSIASGAGTGTANVSFLRIIRATQQPYQPVAFRVWVKAPVGHQIFVGVKIFDAQGRSVYAGSRLSTTYTQPYYSTSLTLKWNKVAQDGSRLPRGQRFIAIAAAGDDDSSSTQSKIFRSSEFHFTLAS